MPSKTIVLAMLNESGHLNPSYKLAKALKARGHDVRYLAIEDVRAQIEGQGFAVEPLYPELFPAGLLALDERLGTLGKRRAITRRYRSLLRQLLAVPPLELSRVKPDLMLIDVTQTQLALWARKARVPFVYLNTSLPQTRDGGVPPLRSDLPYGASVLGRARAELAWRKFNLKRRLSARAASLVGLTPPYAQAAQQARRFGVERRALDTETAYMPQLRAVAELVFCPQAYDFPRPERADRYHVESIDLERHEAVFDESVLAGDKPLVYCSLGGQRYRANDTPAFFARLLRVFAARPDWQLVLSVGKHVAPSELGRIPANVTVMTVAPQLAILRRAKVMITHGGLGSVKECIIHGVPMLVCPLDVDQPGNGARVEHHGIGLRCDVKLSSARELSEALARLLVDASFRMRCVALQQRFLELEQERPGVAIVERFLS